MNVYTLKPQFDPNSGGPIDPVPILSGLICDFSGNFLDRKIDWGSFSWPNYDIQINYDDSSEEVWHDDKERKEFEELGASYDRIFSSPFCFEVLETVSGHTIDASILLIEKWAKEYNNEESWLFNAATIEEIFRRSRIQVIRKLLAEKKYTIKELNIDQ
jgi:hypothetical protein